MSRWPPEAKLSAMFKKFPYKQIGFPTPNDYVSVEDMTAILRAKDEMIIRNCATRQNPLSHICIHQYRGGN